MMKILTSFILIILISCGSTDISRFYYIFNDEQTEILRDKPLEHRCLVNNFHVSSWLRKREIPVRPSSNRIDYYDQYAWISVPAVLYAEFTYEAFRRSNLFSSVVRTTEERDFDLAIDGYLDHLEIVQRDDSVFAWIEGEFSCTSIKNNRLVAKHRFSNIELIKGKATANKFVQISNLIFQFNLHKFMKKCELSLEPGDQGG